MVDVEFPIQARALGERLGAEVVGDAGAEVRALAPLPGCTTGTLSYLSNPRYAPVLSSLEGGVVITERRFVRAGTPLTFLVVEDPQAVFAGIVGQQVPEIPFEGVSPLASIDPSVKLGDKVSIAPFVFIGRDSCIGAGSRLYPHVYVGAGVTLGERCDIHPGVVLHSGVWLGDRVRVLAGSVLGSDGFGLFRAKGADAQREMPHVGTLVVEDGVRIGANCTIDRGTLGETRICRNAMLDDQVHVGHNCTIGPGSIVCAQVGLSGSVILEEDSVIAGQAGIAEGVRVGRGAVLKAQSGAGIDLEPGKTYFGSPALPSETAFRILRAMRRLPRLLDRLRACSPDRAGDGEGIA